MDVRVRVFIIIFSAEAPKKSTSDKMVTGINFVNELGELWDEREYDEEFKVKQFLEKLKN